MVGVDGTATLQLAQCQLRLRRRLSCGRKIGRRGTEALALRQCLGADADLSGNYRRTASYGNATAAYYHSATTSDSTRCGGHYGTAFLRNCATLHGHGLAAYDNTTATTTAVTCGCRGSRKSVHRLLRQCGTSLGGLRVANLLGNPLEARDDEHEHLGAHPDTEHQVGARKVEQLEQRAEYDDGRAPAVGVVHKGLPCQRVHPLLDAVYKVQFACHNI